jgi:hypothetical protein
VSLPTWFQVLLTSMPSVTRCLSSALWSLALPAGAGEVDVVAAEVRCSAQRTCAFSATLRHDDTGWDHFADRWEVLGPDGEVLATRILRHPHVDEQPFTRALRGVELPADLELVRIRGHDRVHEYGGAEHELRLPPPARSEDTAAPEP